jgi:hypothetical protein
MDFPTRPVLHQEEPYEETRPAIACFTRHVETMQDGGAPRRTQLPTEIVTWQLGLRAQTPAYRSRSVRKGTPGWNKHHHYGDHSSYKWRDHSFDMLGEISKEASQASSPNSTVSSSGSTGTPRVRIDTLRHNLFFEEPYKPKVAPNFNNYRHHLRVGAHPEECRWILSITSR